MQGNLSCPMTEDAAKDMAEFTGGNPERIAALQAKWALLYADALIAALSVKERTDG